MMECKTRVNLSSNERYGILRRDEFTCQYCGRKAPDVELHVDHLIPVSRGGENEELNLLASCIDCNLSKSAEILPEHIIEEKVEAIKERIDINGLGLKYIRKSKRILKPKRDDLKVRPIKLLSNYWPIAEPFKGKGLNPSTKHGLKIIVTKDYKLFTYYGNKFNYGWSFKPIHRQSKKTGLTPLTEKMYFDIVDVQNFTKIKEYTEEKQTLEVYRGESGIYLLIIGNTDDKGRVMSFGFWSPTDNFEFKVELNAENGELY